MSKTTRYIISIASFGVILANITVASSSTFESFAPISMTTTALYAATFICGLILGTTVDDARAILYGGCLMALTTVLIFSAAVVLAAWLANTPFLDIVLLFAFQQSFPRFIFLCVLGYVGAFVPTFIRPFFGRL